MTKPAKSAESGADPAPSAPARPKRPGSFLLGNVGPVRAKLRKALQEARAADRMTTEDEVRALLAERYAAYVDRATSSSDGAALLRAGEKLLELLAALPVREPAKGGEPGDGGDDRGQLLSVLDGGPTVGDAANA